MVAEKNINPDPVTRADDPQTLERAVDSHRWRELRRLERWLEKPMVVLGLIWLVLLIVELTRQLNPALEMLATGIWIVFIADFLLRLWIAPRKGRFLRRNVLTIVSLVVPALRVFRVLQVLRFARYLRAARAVRGLRLVKVVGSINRGMRALGNTMSRRGFGYVLALTILVTFTGAAGMYAFERGISERGLNDYGTALWWTAMLITTVASEYWPQTVEGRILCLLLTIYGFGVWGYVTATIASFFIGRDAENDRAELAGRKSVDRLHREIAELSQLVRQLRAKPPSAPETG